MTESPRPRRQRPRGEVAELPSLAEASPDDEAYMRAMLALAETGAMFRGRYVEAHVARILGAVFPETGINEWDLMIPGEPPAFLEVKARGIDRANDLVWVFVRIDSPMGERPCEFTYAVAGPAQRREMAARMGRSVGVSKLLAALETVSAGDLLAAVRSSFEGHR